MTVREPTSEECNTNASLEVEGYDRAFAAWYPQMGGYGSRCIVAYWHDEYAEDPADACFDVFVWHDGEFPFSEDTDVSRLGYARPPARLHHCRAEQFIRFGQTIEKKMRGA